MARIVAVRPNRPPVRDEFGPKVRVHTRYYLADGSQVPGTTTITALLAKPWLVRWANDLGIQGIDADLVRDEAASIGKLAHYFIECALSQIQPVVRDFTEAQIDAARRPVDFFGSWARQHVLEPDLIEQPLVSERYGYGGTIDYFGLVDEIPTLVDYKTGNGLYWEHSIQCAAYAYLLREHGKDLRAARVLRIGRSDEGYQEKVLTGEETRTNFRVFLHLLEVYRYRKALGVR
jgi:hypothetical protein